MKKIAHNIVLIGMPGSGKSFVGKELAKALAMGFFDTDEQIESSYGKIPDLFQIGEDHFRRIETKVLAQLLASAKGVISTGGGIVTREENISLMKKAGIVFFLDRHVELIMGNPELQNRPLLAGQQTRQKLEALYRQRYKLYVKAADFIIDNNGTLDLTLNQIQSKLSMT